MKLSTIGYVNKNNNMQGRKDLRTGKGTYITQLWKAPTGARIRHCAENAYGIKACDAYQMLASGRTVIWARGDLVEVWKEGSKINA